MVGAVLLGGIDGAATRADIFKAFLSIYGSGPFYSSDAIMGADADSGATKTDSKLDNDRHLRPIANGRLRMAAAAGSNPARDESAEHGWGGNTTSGGMGREEIRETTS